MNPAIAITDLSVKIDKTKILSGINAEIPEGSIVGLLGPSGSGKTTLIRSILGLQKLTKGSVEVLGQKAGHRKLKSEIGYVTQAPSVYSDLTVLENIRYFGSLLGVSNTESDKVLAKVELDNHKSQLVSNLSGGQKARVSLAAALLGKPRILLLDEPTVGLDPVLRQNLWEVFKLLSKEGTTILISSHVMDEADKCDKLIFLRGGRLLISDTKESVLSKTNATSMEDAFLKLAGGQK